MTLHVLCIVNELTLTLIAHPRKRLARLVYAACIGRGCSRKKKKKVALRISGLSWGAVLLHLRRDPIDCALLYTQVRARNGTVRR